MSYLETRTDPPPVAAPVEMISAYLDFQRATMLWKLDGLSREELIKPRTPSGLSLLGMLKHSAYVERWWFQSQFAGRDVWYPWTVSGDFDADWRIEPDEAADQIVALYQQECAVSREIIAAASWDELAKGERSQKEGLTLGWILCHMLEEISRHNGQADIIRESIDGLVGE